MRQIILLSVLCCVPVLAYSQSYDYMTTRDTMETQTLQGVTIRGQANRQQVLMKSSQSVVNVGKEFIETHLGGSLMQSLEQIPGVKAMSIGSGESKPTIRGLGFNRMAVTENGIKHEGQQWGEDHGLEISQMDIDRVEIVKGPSALTCGSDAIGGVINIYSDALPERKIEGRAQLFLRSVNNSVGGAVRLGGITPKGFYWKLALSGTDYADMKVPTDSIQYYSYYIKLKDGRLRNTAGSEIDGSATLGYWSERFSTSLRVSDTNGKSGFFANAHGLEVRLSDIDYDSSERDIDLPYHKVNHLKVLSHSELHLSPLWHLFADLGYQHNRRDEESEPVSHGYMPRPATTLERRFDKDTYTALLSAKTLVAERHNLSIGASMEHQNNKRDGWGFVIPDFHNLTAGAYVYDRWHLSERLILSGGVRYDWTRTHIMPYVDWYETLGEYRQRSEDRVLYFRSLTWALGINYALGPWTLKANVGKGFRTPLPKELGTDGVNYHIFRYERGNPDLNPEESYQVDGSVNYAKGKLTIQVDPYLSWFSNYIYMSPTPEYYEGLQVYTYEQARVLRWGVEGTVRYEWLPQLESELQGEFLYARLASGSKKGYTLPFSQPWNVQLMLKYKPLEEGYVSVTGRYTGKQTEIVPPEKPTDGYFLLNAAMGYCFHFSHLRHKHALTVTLQAQNILNKRYYDHTSYYRLIGVPEAGRNFSLVASYAF